MNLKAIKKVIKIIKKLIKKKTNNVVFFQTTLIDLDLNLLKYCDFIFLLLPPNENISFGLYQFLFECKEFGIKQINYICLVEENFTEDVIKKNLKQIEKFTKIHYGIETNSISIQLKLYQKFKLDDIIYFLNILKFSKDTKTKYLNTKLFILNKIKCYTQKTLSDSHYKFILTGILFNKISFDTKFILLNDIGIIRLKKRNYESYKNKIVILLIIKKRANRNSFLSLDKNIYFKKLLLNWKYNHYIEGSITSSQPLSSISLYQIHKFNLYNKPVCSLDLVLLVSNAFKIIIVLLISYFLTNMNLVIKEKFNKKSKNYFFIRIKNKVDYKFVIIKKLELFNTQLIGIGSYVSKIKSSTKLFKKIANYSSICHEIKKSYSLSLYFCSNISTYFSFGFKYTILFKNKTFLFRNAHHCLENKKKISHFQKGSYLKPTLFPKTKIFSSAVCNKTSKYIDWSSTYCKIHIFSTLISSTLYFYLKSSRSDCDGFSSVIKFKSNVNYTIFNLSLKKEIHLNYFNLLSKYNLLKTNEI